jgi:uncharacterized coiled-coil protein SlyX
MQDRTIVGLSQTVAEIKNNFKTTYDRIAEDLPRYFQINNKVTHHKKEIQKARDACQNAIDKHENSISICQSSCDHPLKKFHGDASGGNGPHMECLVCQNRW